MSANTLPVTTGSVGGVQVVAQVSSASLAVRKTTVLTADYARENSAYPDPGAWADAKSRTGFPQLIPAGTEFEVFGDEADALAALGFATIA